MGKKVKITAEVIFDGLPEQSLAGTEYMLNKPIKVSIEQVIDLSYGEQERRPIFIIKKEE